MKLYDAGITIMIVAFVVTCIIGGVSYEYLGQSNVITQDIEKAAETEGEAIVLKETGINIAPYLPSIGATGVAPAAVAGATGATGTSQ